MDNSRLLDAQLGHWQQAARRRDRLEATAQLAELRRWRGERMRRTYADLARQPRYTSAVDFLVQDLFGGENLGGLGEQVRQAQSAMVRFLPDPLLGTVARAVELTALTLDIDLALAQYLMEHDGGKEEPIESRYREAVNRAVSYGQLSRQIELVTVIGHEIESVVHKPFVTVGLKMCRRPARKMGLESLQDFLERGVHAFRTMRGSEEFLQTFDEREHAELDRLLQES